MRSIMKRPGTVIGATLAFLVFFSMGSSASGKAPDKAVKSPGSVDSGSFGILVNGLRLATETFRIEQSADGDSVNSEIKFDNAKIKATQKSEMLILPNGVLKKYTWKETEPGRSQIVVEPQDESFLVMHISESPNQPTKDSIHPLSPDISIMDDNFFSQMEVLAWKYMAFSCRPNVDCKWASLKLPVFVPHEQQSMIVEIDYLGMSKMKMKGVLADYKSFKLKTDAGDSLLWFDDQNKLVRVLMTADNTEVLRD